MTRRTAILMGLALPGGFATIPSWASSNEFWNEKKPSEWTDQEIEQLLTKSPWARDAAVSYYGGQNGPLGSLRGGGGAVRRGRVASGGAAGSPSTGATPAWKAYIRWESALPVREALKAKPSRDAEEFYILNMVGDLPSLATASDESDAQSEARLDALKEYTRLEHKGDEIHLTRAALAPKTALSDAGTLFYFSRALALRLEDKQATFVTKTGPIDVKCRFTLKDMVYRGNLEL